LLVAQGAYGGTSVALLAVPGGIVLRNLFVPNLRRADNVYQGVFVLLLTLVGALLGALGAPITEPREIALSLWTAAGLGAIAGLVGGGLLSGFALMVAGERERAV
jgi:hypothetical protein